MNEKLFFQLIILLISVTAVILIEEMLCFFIIKKRGEIEEFKKYKTQKSFCTYSIYLYKSKKYLFIIKPVIVVFVLILLFLPGNENKYFDAVGNSYKNTVDIMFYDKDGNGYSIDKSTRYFIDNRNNLTDKCYVDMNGNVSDIDENDLYISSVSGIVYTLNGDVYFSNTNIYWDKDRQMHFFNTRQDIIVNDCEFTVNTETGDCTIEKKSQ